jgi:C-terminal processing protease CtpA/Prc
MIVEVDAGSPAQQAGVQANDELIAVDGVATENKPLAEIMWPIKRHMQKQPVEITLRRDGQDLKVRMTPQP